MTWTVVTKYSRPNTDNDWYNEADTGFGPMTDADTAYVKNNYVDNGKRVSSNTTMSADTLERTKTFVFRDKAAYDEYAADSKIASFISAQMTYNIANNITLVTRFSSAT